MSDKNKYPTFARTTPSTSKVAKSVISILDHFNWNHFTIIVGDAPKWLEAAQTLKVRTAPQSGGRVRVVHVWICRAHSDAVTG